MVFTSLQSMVGMQAPSEGKQHGFYPHILRCGQSSLLRPFTTQRLLHCHCKASRGVDGRHTHTTTNTHTHTHIIHTPTHTHMPPQMPLYPFPHLSPPVFH